MSSGSTYLFKNDVLQWSKMEFLSDTLTVLAVDTKDVEPAVLPAMEPIILKGSLCKNIKYHVSF